jgi:uncharacterized protein YjdB
VLLVLLVAAALSCGGSATGTDAVTVASVTVTAPLRNVDVGGTAQLSAVARDETGAEIIGVTFQWVSSDKTVATVSSTGVVTGVAVGSVRITAQIGDVSGFADITIGPRMTTKLPEKAVPRG